jgi:hypothetical protein
MTNTLVVGGGSLSSGSALTVNGGLTVSEAITAAGKITANAGIATNALVAGGGSATFGAAVTVNGDSSLNGSAAISGGLTVSATVKAVGHVSAGAGVSVTGGIATDTLVTGGGPLTPGSVLAVNGASSLNGSATVHGSLTVSDTVTASTVSATNISSQGFKVKNGNLNCFNFEFHSIPVSITTNDTLWDGGQFGGYEQDAMVTVSLASNVLDRWNGIPLPGDCSASYYVEIDNSGSGAIHSPLIAFTGDWYHSQWALMGAPITFPLKAGATFHLYLNWQWASSVSLTGCSFELRVYKFGG